MGASSFGVAVDSAGAQVLSTMQDGPRPEAGIPEERTVGRFALSEVPSSTARGRYSGTIKGTLTDEAVRSGLNAKVMDWRLRRTVTVDIGAESAWGLKSGLICLYTPRMGAHDAEV